MSKELGQILKMLRKRCEFTQRQVAEVLHIDRSTYAYYESGATEPELISIRRLAQIYNVDPAILLPSEDGIYNFTLGDVTKEQENAPSQDSLLSEITDEKIYTIAKDERSVLVWYRALSAEKKKAFREIVRNMADEEK